MNNKAQGVKGFILGSVSRSTSLCRIFADLAETFGEVCELHKLSFFPIGHSLAALAFLVFGSGNWLMWNCLRLKTADLPPSDYSVCIA